MELCLFETTECLWIHFQMPRLVQADVEEAVRVLYRSLDFALTNEGLENLILDVPQYMFVSTQVARRYHTLFESAVVRAFQTCMGGVVIRKLRDESITRYTQRVSDSWGTVIVRSLSAVSMTSLILVVGTLPLQFQRYVCRIQCEYLYYIHVTRTLTSVGSCCVALSYGAGWSSTACSPLFCYLSFMQFN